VAHPDPAAALLAVGFYEGRTASPLPRRRHAQQDQQDAPTRGCSHLRRADPIGHTLVQATAPKAGHRPSSTFGSRSCQQQGPRSGRRRITGFCEQRLHDRVQLTSRSCAGTPGSGAQCRTSGSQLLLPASRPLQPCSRRERGNLRHRRRTLGGRFQIRCHRIAARAASPSRQPCDRPELSPPLRHTGHLPSAPTACSAEIPRARGGSSRSISTRYIHAPSPSTTFDAIPADHRMGETNTTDTALRRFGCGNGRCSHARQEGAARRSGPSCARPFPESGDLDTVSWRRL